VWGCEEPTGFDAEPQRGVWERINKIDDFLGGDDNKELDMKHENRYSIIEKGRRLGS